jgi:hypothetical protein
MAFKADREAAPRNAGVPTAHPTSSRSPAPRRFECGKPAERDPVPEATQADDDTPVQPTAASNQPVIDAAMIFIHKS